MRIRCAIVVVVLATLVLTPLFQLSTASEAQTNENSIATKIRPDFLEKIQETDSDISIIVRLVEEWNTEELKDSVASLLELNHNATAIYKCKALPVITAKVPSSEVEKIAMYPFVESIGNGGSVVYASMDISRQVIRANNVTRILGYNGSGVTIAILDTGINKTHPDLDDLDDDPNTNDPKVISEVSFVDYSNDGVVDENPDDYHGHGTACAGIAAGTGEASNYTYVGVAPGAKLMNVKVLTNGGFRYVKFAQGNVTWIVQGIDWAVYHGADVISMSLSGGFGDGTGELARAVDDAVKRGVVVVVAAGNCGPTSGTITEPADSFNAITVGALDDNDTVTTEDDVIASFSSRGPTIDGRVKPDVVAPGVGIVSPVSTVSALWQVFPGWRVGEYYIRLSGTSIAAPQVAGVVAMLLQAHPDLDPYEVKGILMAKARIIRGMRDVDITNIELKPSPQIGSPPQAFTSWEEPIVMEVTAENRMPHIEGFGLVDAYEAVLTEPHGFDFSKEGVGTACWRFGSTFDGTWYDFTNEMYGQVRYYDNSSVHTFATDSGEYPYHRFTFSNINITEIAQINIEWRGTGYRYEGSGRYVFGAQMFLWNFRTEQWEEVGNSPVLWDASILSTIGFSVEDYVQEGTIEFVVRTSYPAHQGNWSHLFTNYIKLTLYEGVNDRFIPENFTVSAYNGTTVIGSQTIINLLPLRSATVSFIWEHRNVNPVPGQSAPTFTLSTEITLDGDSDSDVVSASITVKHAADANGDGEVFLVDLRILVKAWNTKPPNPKYDPRADFDGDSEVSLADFRILVKNWRWG